MSKRSRFHHSATMNTSPDRANERADRYSRFPRAVRPGNLDRQYRPARHRSAWAIRLMGTAIMALTSCGARAGTEPHDMSAAAHRSLARGEDAQALGHAVRFDPAASRTEEKCAFQARDVHEICWTTSTNPTRPHYRMAQEKRALAQMHRGAAAELAQVEASACAGVPLADREVSPFRHRDDIRYAERLTGLGARYRGNVTLGARIVFQRVPGMSVASLQRVIDCHLARNAVLGPYAANKDAGCPLTLRGVQAVVSSAGTDIAVEIRAEREVVARQIWRRALQLAPHSDPARRAHP